MSFLDPREAAALEQRKRRSRPHILAGAILGAFLSVVLGQVSTPLFWIAVAILPLAGAWGGWSISPESNAIREHRAEEAENLRRAEQLQRKQIEDAWLQRVKEALHWWRVHGSQLLPSPSSLPYDAQRLEDYVRIHAQDILKRKESILRLYKHESDPCSSQEKATGVSTWAIQNHSEMLADLLPNRADRTTDNLTYILLAHHKCEAVLLLPEAEAAIFSAAVQRFPPLKGETIQDTWSRTAHQYRTYLEFRAQARKDAHQVFADLPPEERKAAISQLIAFADKLIRDAIRNLIQEREGAPTQ